MRVGEPYPIILNNRHPNKVTRDVASPGNIGINRLSSILQFSPACVRYINANDLIAI